MFIFNHKLTIDNYRGLTLELIFEYNLSCF